MRIPEYAVVTNGLTKRFGELLAVDHVDLEVPAGSVVSLLGPNGAGKTTIVRMLATLTEPTSGTAVVCGHDVITGGRTRCEASSRSPASSPRSKAT